MASSYLFGHDFLFYSAPAGAVRVQVPVRDETSWLTQRQTAVLFGKDSDTLDPHIRNVFKERKLQGSATTEESSVVRSVERRRRLTRRDTPS